QHFLDQFNRAEGTQKKFSPGTIRELSNYSWPGNVRELKNVIQRGFIMADQTIDLAPLPVRRDDGGGPANTGGPDGIKVGSTVADVERHFILATLEQCGGDKRKAAEILGISLKTLYNRLNLYAARS